MARVETGPDGKLVLPAAAEIPVIVDGPDPARERLLAWVAALAAREPATIKSIVWREVDPHLLPDGLGDSAVGLVLCDAAVRTGVRRAIGVDHVELRASRAERR